MAYRIVYGPEINPPARKNGTPLRRQLLTAAFGLLFVLLVRQLWPDGTEVLRKIFLPGELSVTEQAFRDLLGNIRDGGSFTDAFTVFCRQMIAHAA